MQYKAIRGTADILPADQPFWRYVEEKAVSLCHLYGYERLDTPIFEDSALFVRGVGQGTDIVEKEMYTFQDKGGASITLKPEVTAPICRAYLEHGMSNLSQPVRLYYFSPIFRHERPQAGRYRQHHQFGFEALGEGNPALDVEIVELAWNLLASLGLKGLVLYLNSIGCRNCRPAYLENLRGHYAARTASLCPDCKRRLVENPLRLLDCKQPSCQEAANTAPHSANFLCGDCSFHFTEIKEGLTLLEIPFSLNHRLVRGLDYYTRTVFEIQPERGGAQSTIGGGGRYDDLMENLGGRATPGIGFAAGIERIILNLKTQGIHAPILPAPQVYVAYQGVEALRQGTKVARSLRRAGIVAIRSIGNKSLKAQLRQANSLGIGKVLILGDEELATGTVILRHMTSGEQQQVPEEDAIKLLREDRGGGQQTGV